MRATTTQGREIDLKEIVSGLVAWPASEAPQVLEL